MKESERLLVLERSDGLDGKVVVWELFECDKGGRWSQLNDSLVNLCKQDGQPCDFVGCHTGHFVYKVRETTDRDEANEWYREVTI
jgi:hypothetical protein